MAAVVSPGTGLLQQQHGGGGMAARRKEIYRYSAPWTVYGMNWSVRQDKRFRLAIGSFIEDYCNKVGV